MGMMSAYTRPFLWSGFQFCHYQGKGEGREVRLQPRPDPGQQPLNLEAVASDLSAVSAVSAGSLSAFSV